ncbi:MAG: hypothetical protein UR99_C0017G0030 [Candidatus Moranbacteria bacterium GW2011_GWD2_36_12]|nr:MAG: hypothetical protein UR99_C0017G0030 [Candidatus Moranbacteria bacterium GW2011_GWD2_36_12]
MNEKALVELSLKDQNYMTELLAKSAGALTPAERAHLVARRDYLNKETLERLDIKGAEAIADDNGDGDTDNEYEAMTELKKMCEERDIEIDPKAKKADLVDILKADDNGELEDEDENEDEE